MPIATGVLPDDVISSPDANAYLFAVTLAPTLTAEGVGVWHRDVTALVAELESFESEGTPVASVCTAFSPTFFLAGGQPRFGLSATQIPGASRVHRKSLRSRRSPRSLAMCCSMS